MKPFLVAFFALSVLTSLHAGGKPIYVDYNPQYTLWQDNYIIDKIEYFKNEMVIHFRFIAKPEGGFVTFYGAQMDSSWYIKSTNAEYELQKIKSIAEEGKVLVKSLKTGYYYERKQIPNGTYTCEIVFKRPSKDIKQIDLIEGLGNESKSNHFNAYNIAIKDINSKDLGTEEDMKKRIEALKKVSSQ